MAKKIKSQTFAPTVIAVAVASCFAAGSAWGNPTGAQVVNGAVSLGRPNASTLNVTNSPGAIINWQGFSIGAAEITRFIQQSSSSAVLNRVVGADISSIQGQLLSNGRVFLINPSGIVVGPGAVIDTAGFVGSTLGMRDADFLAGRLKFEGDANSGRIVNQGWIKTAQGGQVMLVAPQIENSGLIQTPGGELILAAGKKLSISSLDHEGVQFEVQAPTDSVVNIGKLLAEGGAIGVFAGTLRHSGEIRATTLSTDATGQIVLEAQKDIGLAAGSITSVSGVTGGTIQIQSGDTTLVAGTVEARGLGSSGKGGIIHLLGDKVGVLDGARVNASGETGGGTILVGGDYKGGNSGIRNASGTFFGADATLRADATANGEGGRIILWSDEATRAYGTISAHGANGGKGGFVETSSKGYLEVTQAPQVGAGGLWLLDPRNIEVVAGNGVVNNDGAPTFTPSGDNSQVGANLISGQLAAGSNVTLDTSGAGAQAGNITVSSAIAANTTGSPVLALNANNTIGINAAVSITNGATPAGEVRLVAGNGITQSAVAPITADKLLANGGSGTVQMGLAGNMVNTLAGSAKGDFQFRSAQNLTIGTVAGVSGITVDNTVSNPNNFDPATITITTINGSDLNVNGNVTAAGGTSGSANIQLTAARHLNVTGSTVSATSGNASDFAELATVTLTAGTGNITVNPGSAISATGGNAGNGGGAASVTLNADAGNIAVNSSTITATGGPGGDGAPASVTLRADVGNITINNSSTITAIGGSGSGTGGAATVTLRADAGGITVNSSTVSATAGDGSAAGNAGVTLQADAGSITVNSSTITASGGSGSDGTGGAATVQFLAQTSLDIANNSIVTANGGAGFDGGNATVTLQATTGAITVNNSDIAANGGSGSGGPAGAATVTLQTTTGGITVNNGDIAANGGFGGGGTGGAATMTLLATAGAIMINSNSNISAIGGSGSGSAAGGTALVTLTGAGITLGTSTLAATGGDGTGFTGPSATVSLTATSGGDVNLIGSTVTATGGGATTFGGAAHIDVIAEEGAIVQSGGGVLQVTSPSTPSSSTIDLFARDGIGATGAPIRVAGGFTGLTADNANLFPGASGNIVVSQTTGNVMDPLDPLTPVYTFTNAATNGGIDIEAEVGSITIPLAGFSNPSGPITLRANTMDIQGTLTAAGNISLQTVTAGHPIELGPLADPVSGPLSLSNAELANLSTSSITIGDSANPVSVTDAITLSQSLSLPGAITVAGLGSFGIDGATNTVGSIAGTGGIVLTGGALAVGSDNTSTIFSGVISGTGGLTKQGIGTLTLSGANTYMGATTVNAGTLALNGGAAIADTGAVSLAGSGGLMLGASETIGSLSGAGGTTVVLGAHTLTAGDTGSTSFAGVMSGTGGLTKQGTGTLTLAGANTYTGTTTVNAGTLAIGAAERISDQSSVTVAGGAIFNLAGFGETVGSIAGAGNITLGAGTLAAGGDNSSTAYSGVMSGTGGLTKQGTGTLTLSGANTYTGTTTVNAGTLMLDGATLSGTLVNQSTTTVGGSSLVSGGVQHSGTLNLNSGGSLTVGGTGFDWQGGTLAGGGSLAMSGGAPFKVTGGTIHTLNGPTMSVANLDLTGGSLNLQSGTVNVSGTITVGSGTTLASQGATINGPGATLDLSGVFQVGGGFVTLGDMNVLVGGVLKGTGTVNANVNNSAGTVSPGLSPGILTINGNYVQGAGGTLNMEIGGLIPGASGHDQLVVTGTAMLDGTLNASLINGYIPAAGNSFTLVQAGSVSGTFATTNLPAETFLAPSYLVSSFVVSTLPAASTGPTGPQVPPIVVVEIEKLRKAVEEGPEKPEAPGPMVPICR